MDDSDIAQREATVGEEARPPHPHSHLFAVRLWKEDVEGEVEYRGSVRDVLCGAFRAFRRWPDLADFMVAQLEDVHGTAAAPTEGGT